MHVVNSSFCRQNSALSRVQLLDAGGKIYWVQVQVPRGENKRTAPGCKANHETSVATRRPLFHKVNPVDVMRNLLSLTMDYHGDLSRYE